jgi:hypothetical protein
MRAADDVLMTLMPFSSGSAATGARDARAAARALDKVVEAVDAPAPGLGCVGPDYRAAIRDARREISALATELVERDRSDPAGVALARDIGDKGVLALYSCAGAHRTVEQARTARALLSRAALDAKEAGPWT